MEWLSIKMLELEHRYSYFCGIKLFFMTKCEIYVHHETHSAHVRFIFSDLVS